jgi:hypothetical protein
MTQVNLMNLINLQSIVAKLTIICLHCLAGIKKTTG